MGNEKLWSKKNFRNENMRQQSRKFFVVFCCIALLLLLLLCVWVYANVVTALDSTFELATRLKYDKNFKTQLHRPIHAKHKRPFSCLITKSHLIGSQFSCQFFSFLLSFCSLFCSLFLALSLYISTRKCCCVCVLLFIFYVRLISNDHAFWIENRWVPYFWTVWIMQRRTNRIKTKMRSSKHANPTPLHYSTRHIAVAGW